MLTVLYSNLYRTVFAFAPQQILYFLSVINANILRTSGTDLGGGSGVSV